MDFSKRDILNVFFFFLEFCRNIVAIQNSFKKFLSVIYLDFIKFVFDKFSEHFLHL